MVCESIKAITEVTQYRQKIERRISMNNLSTELTLGSREVAKMVGKRHDNLVRDIDTYVDYLENSKLRNGGATRVKDFFKFCFYKSGNPPRNYRGYKISKKGCEFIAHKLTGQKGAEFTATYINKFHEMEGKLQPQSIEDLIILQAKSVKELKKKVDQQQEQLDTMKDALIHTDRDWRNWTNEQLNTIGFKINNYREIKKQSYDILENRARCRLSVRLQNLRDRLKEAGASKTAINNANYLDVIEEDSRLKEIYTSIVEKLAIKYSA